MSDKAKLIQYAQRLKDLCAEAYKEGIVLSTFMPAEEISVDPLPNEYRVSGIHIPRTYEQGINAYLHSPISYTASAVMTRTEKQEDTKIVANFVQRPT